MKEKLVLFAMGILVGSLLASGIFCMFLLVNKNNNRDDFRAMNRGNIQQQMPNNNNNNFPGGFNRGDRQREDNSKEDNKESKTSNTNA